MAPGELHVTNGDATIPALRGTGLAETIIAWRDVLHEGPVPAVPDHELRRIRADFLSAANAGDIGTAAEFEWRDHTLAAHRDGTYFLWFEADLYDQLQLIQILARLHSLRVDPGRITLICIGEHLGFAHFGGLGELSSEQLSALADTSAITLTSGAMEHATRAWAAYRATDPSELGVIASTPSTELRFLAEAFDRVAREYPSTRDGLALTERRILAAVDAAATTAGDAFQRTGAREQRPFLGDTWCFDKIDVLATAPVALLTTEPGGPGLVDRHTSVALTAAGHRVLEGAADHVQLNGVDRWVGGVHLLGREPGWRWHEGTERLRGRADQRHSAD